MTKKVALLRAVNVGGRKLPMAALRELCADLGWTDVATYIQSGNVVFDAPGDPEALEAALERAIEGKLGMKVPVMVRSAGQLRAHLDGNPFPGPAKEEPNRLMLLLSKRPPARDAGEVIQARAAAGEQVRRAGDALWIHYPAGAGTSKLTPSLIDRAVGSPTTARNCRTATRLSEMMTG